jgi:hypothetical protein
VTDRDRLLGQDMEATQSFRTQGEDHALGTRRQGASTRGQMPSLSDVDGDDVAESTVIDHSNRIQGGVSVTGLKRDAARPYHSSALPTSSLGAEKVC